ncbi:XkdW family protein [Bacillus mojavensis]|uniref:XkdW family protein n=1 Tax=Bacillus mojavensis TaxID=72360 RepID=UPI002282AF3A|nr:XkdW family protein [Bacillus mojavensis]MCY8103428.1 XkdW family protein [Bacillus mojavensis]MCY8481404.1 XkdW family protein [Bacillus mojavensis]
MKLIYPYGEDNIYLGRPVELHLDRESGRYNLPANATDLPPEINGEGMWRPLFDEEKQIWVETADEEYKDGLKQGNIPESNPITDQLATLGQQLADEKLARKQAEQAQNALGMQLTAEVLARKEAEALNQSLGEQMAVLKLDVLSLKGGMTNES